MAITTNNAPQKAALYVRLSNEDRHKAKKGDDSESIVNQRRMLIDYCNAQNLSVYDIYSDEDFSGTDRDRPEFNRMIRDAKSHKFDVVLTKTQSRFARDIEIVEKYINGLFPLWGIRYIGVVDHTDNANIQNLKQRQINSLIDEWYCADLSANVRATLKSKREQGLFVGAFAPFGYVKDPNNKNHLIIDGEAAEIVRYVFQLYAQGLGIKSIARRLNSEKIPNPATYKKQHGQPFQNINRECSDIWHDFSVGNMLSNMVYIGYTVQGKQENISYKSQKKRVKPKSEWTVVEGTHEPIIDMDTWDKVQKIREGKPKSTKATGAPNILANKVKCLECGGSMRISYCNHTRYFRCNTHFFDVDRCRGKYISEKVLHEIIIKEIHNLYNQYIDVCEISDRLDIKNGIDEKIKRLKAKSEAAGRELNKIEHRLKNIYIDKIDGIITQEEFINLKAQFEKDKAGQQSQIDDCQNEIVKIEKQALDAQSKMDLIQKYKDITKLDFATVNTLIDYVEVGGSRDNRIVNIHWNL